MISIKIKKKLRASNGQQVLEIEREFRTGSITQIYGPSGSGKTTFLKIIAGFISPEEGIISVDDIAWFDSAAKINLSPQKRTAGFVFQDYALFPNMTVIQHLQYATADSQWIDKLLEIGRLETLTGQKPAHLSGGQQQRLAILRALAIKPRLLLMDEPFSALDPEMKSALIIKLKQIFDELGTTVMIVTHNPAELAMLQSDELLISGKEPE